MVLQDISSPPSAPAFPMSYPGRRLCAPASMAPVPRSLAGALAGGGLSVIAEVKRRSPSKGAIDPSLIRVRWLRPMSGGAAAISVPHGGGPLRCSLRDLAAVRAAVGVPVLRKDFVLHPRSGGRHRAMGADAVLPDRRRPLRRRLAIALDAARKRSRCPRGGARRRRGAARHGSAP